MRLQQESCPPTLRAASSAPPGASARTAWDGRSSPSRPDSPFQARQEQRQACFAGALYLTYKFK